MDLYLAPSNTGRNFIFFSSKTWSLSESITLFFLCYISVNFSDTISCLLSSLNIIFVPHHLLRYLCFCLSIRLHVCLALCLFCFRRLVSFSICLSIAVLWTDSLLIQHRIKYFNRRLLDRLYAEPTLDQSLDIVI